jgi:branched-chain amino acid transport system ATP-binding protein
MKSMSFLEVKDLTIKFGGLIAVDHLSFNVNEGEVISIIGPNGAGKTTVFNMLTGLYTPSSGSMIFKGQNLIGMRPQDIVRLGIARTFQNIRIFNEMRVIENILIGSQLDMEYNLFDTIFRTKRFRLEESKKTAEVMDFLYRMKFEDKAHAFAGSLSYADMRRLEILRAMATGAKILLLDEPAAGMNPLESEIFIEFVSEIARDEGYTIILIEHDMNVVMNVADRIYVLNYGKLIAEGIPEEIRANPTVINAYLGGVVS